MNYRHAFHAGNHADVFKHVVLLALLDALKRKDSPFVVLDTHAGRGRYALHDDPARKTGEAESGVARVLGAKADAVAIRRYQDAVRACNPDGGLRIYPGSPLLTAMALRDDDRLSCRELQPDEARALTTLFGRDRRVHVEMGDGYAAMKALLPPKPRRGLVLIDPPYETQEAEFGTALAALAEALQRWPQGIYALWFPIKQRRSLQRFLRAVAKLPAQEILLAELLIRPDDSPLRLNGSGMLLFNPPWKLDAEIAAALPVLARELGEAGASHRLEWLKSETTP
ncbi:MAG TPA: 23S rRNA (adenine(2030)-N(6))-methyltransferase RlmJ [Xanthomonadaceae bacterium]|jgi:23S rRNA (adenine2030-N6)-methyltransferase|nr:23S rRNA (adenine(2030)-N(6))-methyltransferase RlmJ [Xanthomonadaceae bacterium]